MKAKQVNQLSHNLFLLVIVNQKKRSPLLYSFGCFGDHTAFTIRIGTAVNFYFENIIWSSSSQTVSSIYIFAPAALLCNVLLPIILQCMGCAHSHVFMKSALKATWGGSKICFCYISSTSILIFSLSFTSPLRASLYRLPPSPIETKLSLKSTIATVSLTRMHSKWLQKVRSFKGTIHQVFPIILTKLQLVAVISWRTLPQSFHWAPMTAQRYVNLHAKGGRDDYFSSDYMDDKLANCLRHVSNSSSQRRHPDLRVLVAFSVADLRSRPYCGYVFVNSSFCL